MMFHRLLLKMSNRNVNKNVSTSALSRVERAQINELVVIAFIVCEYAAGHKLLLSYQNTF